MKIISNPDTNLVTSKAIEALNNSLEKNKDKSILLMVSGGSAFSLLDSIKSDLLGPHIVISVLDERYSKDPTINNFAQLKETNFNKLVKEKGGQVIETQPLGNETMEQLSKRFQDSLQLWKQNNPQGVVLITQGIGPDGHTSGVMPFPEDSEKFKELFENDDTWVVSYDAENKNQYPLRVTTTISFLKNIVDESIVYAVGENKKEALKKIMIDGSTAEIPGRVIKEMKDVIFLTDQTV